MGARKESQRLLSELASYKNQGLEVIELLAAEHPEFYLYDGGLAREFAYRPGLGEYTMSISEEKPPVFRNIYSLDGFGLNLWGMSIEELTRQRQLRVFTDSQNTLRNKRHSRLFIPFTSVEQLTDADLIASAVLDECTMMYRSVQLLSRMPPGSLDSHVGEQIVQINECSYLIWMSGDVIDSVQISDSPYHYPSQITITETPQPFPCPIFGGDTQSIQISLVEDTLLFGFAVPELDAFVRLPSGYFTRDPLTSDYRAIGVIDAKHAIAHTTKSNIVDLIDRLLADRGSEQARVGDLAKILVSAPCGVQAAALCALDSRPTLPLKTVGSFRSASDDRWMTVAEVASLLASVGEVAVLDYRKESAHEDWAGVLLLKSDDQYYDENHFVYAKRKGSRLHLYDPLFGYKSMDEDALTDQIIAAMLFSKRKMPMGRHAFAFLAAALLLSAAVLYTLRRVRGTPHYSTILLILVSISAVGCSKSMDTRLEKLSAMTPPELDLGRLIPDNKYSGTFVVCNTSEHPMTNLSVRASCGCTDVFIDKPNLAAGESATIHFDFALPRGLSRTSEILVLAPDYPYPLQTFLVSGFTVTEQDWQIDPDTLTVSLLPDDPYSEIEATFRYAFTGDRPNLSLGASEGIIPEVVGDPEISTSPFRDFSICLYRINIAVTRTALDAARQGEYHYLFLTPFRDSEPSRDTISIPIVVEGVDDLQIYPQEIRINDATGLGVFWVKPASKDLSVQTVVGASVNDVECIISQENPAWYRIIFDALESEDAVMDCAIQFSSGSQRSIKLRILSSRTVAAQR